MSETERTAGQMRQAVEGSAGHGLQQSAQEDALMSNDPAPTPIACNLDALTADERTRRAALATELGSRCRAVVERSDGYTLELDGDDDMARDALELCLLERRCCPFLQLDIRFARGGGLMSLDVSGGEGVKSFLESCSVLGCASPHGE